MSGQSSQEDKGSAVLRHQGKEVNLPGISEPGESRRRHRSGLARPKPIGHGNHGKTGGAMDSGHATDT